MGKIEIPQPSEPKQTGNKSCIKDASMSEQTSGNDTALLLDEKVINVPINVEDSIGNTQSLNINNDADEDVFLQNNQHEIDDNAAGSLQSEETAKEKSAGINESTVVVEDKLDGKTFCLLTRQSMRTQTKLQTLSKMKPLCSSILIMPQ
eukprot:10637130-Ditylum_brightwellii.AAC.1